MGAEREGQEWADVLIVTAVKDEWDAVLAVDTGATPGSVWKTHSEATGPEVAFRDFTTEGGILRIAAVQAFGMGREQAVIAAAPLLERHPEIRCLAMCGVCAGRRGDVALGDVIIADRTWPYDAGKVKVGVDEQGHRTERFQGDMDLYRIHPPEWKQRAERFQPDSTAPSIKERPRSYEEQGDWLLERLARNEDPTTHADRQPKCPDWAAVLEQLWKVKWLEDGAVALTEAGRKHIRRRMTQEPDGLREPGPFKVVVGPIASGAPVVQDPTIFDRLAEIAGMRKVVGLEMEASAILALAYLRKLPYAVVMKGVMDHADDFKSDNMKPFAARASAECLIAFLRQNLTPQSKKEKKDRLDDILLSGTSPLPKFASPAALLNARYEIVPFHGRAGLLEDLRGWCEADGAVAARLIHGSGGMGKTRLLIELCRQMREKGWRAGFVSKRLEPARFGELVASETPTLVVIDYAESRPNLRALLAPVLARRTEGGEGRMRVVLLSRNKGDWWEAVLRSDVADLLLDDAPRELSPLVPAGAEREAVFDDAVARFARERAKQVVPVPAPRLDDSRYDRVLYIHMAALATVDGRAFTTETLMEQTLNHEEELWAQKFGPKPDLDDRLFKKRVRRVVAALTLRGGATDEAEVERLIVRVGGASDETLTMFLRDLYPCGTVEQAAYLAGLEPDLLGEAMVYRALKDEGTGARAVLDRTFEGADERALRTGFVVLGRLSGDHAEAEQWIAQVLERDVSGRAEAAFAAAQIVGERTAHAALGMVLAKALEREGTIELARRLEPELPDPDRTVSLREVGRWVLAKQLEHLPTAGQQSRLRRALWWMLGNREQMANEERARLLNKLTSWQSALGQREAALASTQEVVNIYRNPSMSRPEVFLPKLAMSLNNLGIMQSTLGQREAALISMREAVDIYRRLSESQPGAFLPYLAGSIDNLGLVLSKLGQREAVLACMQEAADIYRKLAETRPGAFLPDVALSLNNLGMMQSKFGQHEDALASTREAVDIHRKLSQSWPEGFLPNLAGSLQNLGMMQSALGQREAALASTLEAADIRRNLALARPEAFLRDLAGTLRSLGTMQSALGQREAALASTQEATDILHKLALARPEAFLPDLAEGLNSLSAIQSALGQREAALASALAAVSRYRELAQARPEAFLPDLAISLNTLSFRQGELGQHEAALASAKEALETIWPFFMTLPAAFEHHVGVYVDNVRKRLSSLDRLPSPEFLQRIKTFEAKRAYAPSEQ